MLKIHEENEKLKVKYGSRLSSLWKKIKFSASTVGIYMSETYKYNQCNLLNIQPVSPNLPESKDFDNKQIII